MPGKRSNKWICCIQTSRINPCQGAGIPQSCNGVASVSSCNYELTVNQWKITYVKFKTIFCLQDRVARRVQDQARQLWRLKMNPQWKLHQVHLWRAVTQRLRWQQLNIHKVQKHSCEKLLLDPCIAGVTKDDSCHWSSRQAGICLEEYWRSSCNTLPWDLNIYWAWRAH